KKILGNWWSCLTGNSTWVGYNTKVSTEHLPKIQPSVFTFNLPIDTNRMDEGLLKSFNLLYATHYSVGKDLEIMLKAFFKG
ncbi:MAG: glycosyl transferase family 2, partial [Bacteroidota bacterium]